MKKCAEAYRKQKGGHNATVKGPAGKSKAKHTHVGDNPAKKPPSAEDVSDTEMELTSASLPLLHALWLLVGLGGGVCWHLCTDSCK